ncbi:MAG: phosphatidylserine decarboxylase [Prevotella sp.]|nr:phosphatidylserine decarboxylase [Prevotella sp.]MCM1074424.1 phosphatidylserine decarboxylase [Ruminococcus sp.]
MGTKSYSPVVQELIDMIARNGWQDKFRKALDNVHAQNVIEYENIKTLDDYFDWCESNLHWVPKEDPEGDVVYQHVTMFYFLLDQSPVKELQTPITPSTLKGNVMPELTELSKWMRKFVISLGMWMDTPESLDPAAVKSYYDSPRYNMDDYEMPMGGWKTFNQFFARRVKPGYRPIAAINDDHVITSPADSTNDGQWEVNADSKVNIKGLEWSVEELLEGSAYKDDFRGGIWIHQFLNTTDYHRQHAPVGGKVLEAREIQGATWLGVHAEPIEGDPQGRQHIVRRKLVAEDEAGYQFLQTRGLIVIQSKIGKVAILPMGMAQVSSIIVTAEPGTTLRKGEEISYFQFGGSDIVMVFERASNVSITAQPGVHYKVGTRIAQAFPVGE